jgi:prepilin-type N-terminal cleavage/methylation domain-containing protein
MSTPRPSPLRSRAGLKPSGFTLVELLVVISIIAVLVGLLLPALSRARRSAMQTTVLSQLCQIGIAVASYEAEFKNRYPTDLTADNSDGRAFGGLEILASRYKLPPKLFINPNTNDTAAHFKPDGTLSLAELDGAPITLDTPAKIDAENVSRVVFHCSFAYDHEKKRSGRANAPRVYLGDRADYARGRSFSANWGTGKDAGMCLLWTDQHAEFVKTNAIREQHDPNIYHHNQYYDDNGKYPGEGGDEVTGDIAVTPNTLDTHLRFFSEEEDDELLANP